MPIILEPISQQAPATPPSPIWSSTPSLAQIEVELAPARDLGVFSRRLAGLYLGG